MARPDGVDIVCFHKHEVSFHEFERNGTPEFRVVFMPIGAFKNDPFAIDFDQSVFHFYLSETYAVSNEVNVVEGYDKVIQRGRFRRPL